MKTEFIEKQKFTQWWLWLIFIGLAGVTIYGLYEQLLNGKQIGNQPVSDVGLIIISIFVFGFLYGFWFMSLTTKVNKECIKFHFKPFVKKEVKWAEIKSAKIINFGFVGYGIRFGSKHGTIYNIKGNIGLAIELKNGRKMVIGTQKGAELEKVIDKFT